jgi:hypothetical protein
LTGSLDVRGIGVSEDESDEDEGGVPLIVVGFVPSIEDVRAV